MGIQQEPVVVFTDFAKSQLETHTEQLKKQYKSEAGETETLRLKVFNEHLHSLKYQLNEKINELSFNSSDSGFRKALEHIYNTHIDDFLKRDFNVID